MSVNLQKGQRLSLKKEAGNDLSAVIIGLGWDPVKGGGGILGGLFGSGGGDIDLDASLACYDAQKRCVDMIWFGDKKNSRAPIYHTGDNLTGEGEGDDEQIVVDLSQVPANIQSMVVCITSYRGQKFSQIENAFCRVVDQRTRKELTRYTLSDKGNHTAMIMVSIYRKGDGWSVRAIGQSANGKTVKDLVGQMANYA